MTHSTKTLIYLLLICPTLYSMQDPHEINQALIIAASTHNASAYSQAARVAIAYAKNHPQNIDELAPGIHLNNLTPDFAGHVISIGYGIATNNHLHTAISTASALISALTLRQNRTEYQNDWGTIARILTFSLNGLPLGFSIGDAIAHHSWQRMIPTLISYGIHFIPYIREEAVASAQYHLAERLGEIEREEERIMEARDREEVIRVFIPRNFIPQRVLTTQVPSQQPTISPAA